MKKIDHIRVLGIGLELVVNEPPLQASSSPIPRVPI